MPWTKESYRSGFVLPHTALPIYTSPEVRTHISHDEPVHTKHCEGRVRSLFRVGGEVTKGWETGSPVLGTWTNDVPG